MPFARRLNDKRSDGFPKFDRSANTWRNAVPVPPTPLPKLPSYSSVYDYDYGGPQARHHGSVQNYEYNAFNEDMYASRHYPYEDYQHFESEDSTRMVAGENLDISARTPVAGETIDLQTSNFQWGNTHESELKFNDFQRHDHTQLRDRWRKIVDMLGDHDTHYQIDEHWSILQASERDFESSLKSNTFEHADELYSSTVQYEKSIPKMRDTSSISVADDCVHRQVKNRWIKSDSNKKDVKHVKFTEKNVGRSTVNSFPTKSSKLTNGVVPKDSIKESNRILPNISSKEANVTISKNPLVETNVVLAKKEIKLQKAKERWKNAAKNARNAVVDLANSAENKADDKPRKSSLFTAEFLDSIKSEKTTHGKTARHSLQPSVDKDLECIDVDIVVQSQSKLSKSRRVSEPANVRKAVLDLVMTKNYKKHNQNQRDKMNPSDKPLSSLVSIKVPKIVKYGNLRMPKWKPDLPPIHSNASTPRPTPRHRKETLPSLSLKNTSDITIIKPNRPKNTYLDSDKHLIMLFLLLLDGQYPEDFLEKVFKAEKVTTLLQTRFSKNVLDLFLTFC